jgi:hypothetical protein
MLEFYIVFIYNIEHSYKTDCRLDLRPLRFKELNECMQCVQGINTGKKRVDQDTNSQKDGDYKNDDKKPADEEFQNP